MRAKGRLLLVLCVAVAGARQETVLSSSSQSPLKEEDEEGPESGGRGGARSVVGSVVQHHPSCDQRPVVTIPAVRKGISNQRMRIVQDIASAVSLGLSVRLPRALTSRRACHSENCYHDYLESYVSIWSVYDREMTLESLRRLGVCVVRDDIFDDELREDDVGVVAPLQWPIAMSDLAAHSATISSWMSAMNNASVSFALADSRYCCTLLIPDSSDAVRILSRINDAFVAAKRFKQHAKYVLQAFRARLTASQREQQRLDEVSSAASSSSRPMICAAHWRDEDDFVVEEQDLDRAAYGRVMASAVASLEDRCGGALLLLGQVPTRRLEAIRGVLSQARCAERIKDDEWRDYYDTSISQRTTKTKTNEKSQQQLQQPQHVIRYNETCLDQEDPELYEPPRVYTKHSLIDVRRLNWAAEYGGLDDLLAMVDFEIGKRADFFVGSPFSSFSGLIAFSRVDDPAQFNDRHFAHYNNVPKLLNAPPPPGSSHENNKRGVEKRYGATTTIMPAQIDVEDHLAKLFRLQFPHHPSAISPDPCAELVALSPKLAKRLSRKSCAFDDPSGASPPEPHPRTGTSTRYAAHNTVFGGANKNECYRLLFRWVAPYCTSLLPRALVLLLVCVVATRPRRAARPIFLTLTVSFFAVFSILVLCHLNCPDGELDDPTPLSPQSSSPSDHPPREGFVAYRTREMAAANGGAATIHSSRKFSRPKAAYEFSLVRDTTTITEDGGASVPTAALSARNHASPLRQNAKEKDSGGDDKEKPLESRLDEVRAAVVSANFGAADALNNAPRQEESSQISFFLFSENRDVIAVLRGWTLVLPIRMAPREHARQDEARLKSQPGSHGGARAVAYSKTWDDALERINVGKRRWDRVATGVYPARSGTRAHLPFDLASLEYTRRNGISPRYEDAQNLIHVMAPKFVKLNMFRIDVLASYDVLIWADASLVLDTAAVSRALKPLFRADADLVVQPHPKRNSTHEELTHILEGHSERRFKAIASYLRMQRSFYQKDSNFTDEHGLYWMAYFGARRTQRTVDFFERWWLEVRRWQYRDQVSVMYALNSVPERERPKVTTFDTEGCCKAPGGLRRLPKEQVLCITLVGDCQRCCRRCHRTVPYI